MFRQNLRLLAAPLDIKAAFKILGLNVNSSSSTTPEDARQQYLKLARQYHPDVSNGDDTKMKQVNLAYEVVQSYAASSGGNFSSLVNNNNNNRKKSKQDMTAAERAEAERNNNNNTSKNNEEDDDDGFGNNDENDDTTSSWREKRQQQKKKKYQQNNKKSNLSDASTWNTRPEFEWNEAIFNVKEADASNPRYCHNEFLFQILHSDRIQM